MASDPSRLKEAMLRAHDVAMGKKPARRKRKSEHDGKKRKKKKKGIRERVSLLGSGPSWIPKPKQRKMPIKVAVLKVINALRARPGLGAMAVDEVEQQGDVHILDSPDLLAELRRNARLEVVGEGRDMKLRFLPEYSVSNRAELIELVRRTPKGVNVQQLKDSYYGVEKDVDTLVKEKAVYKVVVTYHESSTRNVPFIYPVPAIAADLEIPEEFKTMWKSLPVPLDNVVERHLTQSGAIGTQTHILERRQQLNFRRRNRHKKKPPRVVKILNKVEGIDLTQDFIP